MSSSIRFASPMTSIEYISITKTRLGTVYINLTESKFNNLAFLEVGDAKIVIDELSP